MFLSVLLLNKFNIHLTVSFSFYYSSLLSACLYKHKPCNHVTNYDQGNGHYSDIQKRLSNITFLEIKPQEPILNH